jgi:glycosyltransferase involved in cell wall biosynthesis
MMAVLVVTAENSGIDRYSQELAKRIPVPRMESRRYLSARDTLRLLHKLRQSPYLVHLPGQHFARYALLLRSPFVVTVHDLVRICFPFARENMWERVGLKLDALGLRKAKHIIAVSAWTKADLVYYLKIPEDRISVIYNGIDRQVFKPVSGGRFSFPYLLYVGSERPRKNLGTLLRTFATLKSEGGALSNLKLVKVGSCGRTRECRQTTLAQVRRLGLQDEIIFAEYVSDGELASYYSSAIALVVPSLYEGFGLPLVEAMAYGCPIIASNISSLPEVAGDAALFFAPHDCDELAQLIRRVITEPELKSQLVSKGSNRVKLFSWERTAQQTLQVYHSVESKLNL